MCPSATMRARHETTRTRLMTVARQRDAGDCHVFALSVAYELELTGVVDVLRLSGIPPLRAERSAADPLVLAGGPITFSNPLPLGALADVIVVGEADDLIERVMDELEAAPDGARGDQAVRGRLLQKLSDLPGVLVPSIHGEWVPELAKAGDASLPARSAIRTPNTELHDMFLIEPERGCHRGCTFCVMRRSTNDGMRWFPVERVTRWIPEGTPRVGLVGAAVTDHPRIKEILRHLVEERGLGVGISSLRADRLDDEFVRLLVRGGYRSMTVALDAASARLRDAIEKNLRDRHIEAAAELARAHGMRHLKLYVIVGLPEESDEDRAELVQFVRRLSQRIPIVLGVSPFVPKWRTPLADAPFAGPPAVRKMLTTLKRDLKGLATIRGPGPREAYVEYRLAQGGFHHGAAAVAVADAGGSLGAWRVALTSLDERVRPRAFERLVPPPTRRRLRLVPESAAVIDAGRASP